MRSLLIIVSLVLIHLAIPGKANFWHDLGDSIDHAMNNYCKCPQALMGKIRCGYEINQAIGHKKHKHCHPRVIYACDTVTTRDKNGHFRTNLVSKRLDACDREETCMKDEGDTRYCQYTRAPGQTQRKIPASEETWSQEDEFGAPLTFKTTSVPKLKATTAETVPVPKVTTAEIKPAPANTSQS